MLKDECNGSHMNTKSHPMGVNIRQSPLANRIVRHSHVKCYLYHVM